eukprot:TRINITY_DN6721_c0_g1_i11.p2 TRINITY_DN6721_c0_g1~~TRINITY_DN6721_c0_g1_i11.p2  ORF type:complete len:215 (-),score=23.78 TRINITY_DN6721_c0_g1_i11:2170-2814(-)
MVVREGPGLSAYYKSKIEQLELQCKEKRNNLRRLEAQRNALNAQVRSLKEELQLLQEPGSYVGEVVKVMGKNKVLAKVNPEGKYVVEVSKDIDISKLTPGMRVALRNDSYELHKVLPTKVDPLVSLMKVEKVPDSTYDMIGGLDQQIKEICIFLQMFYNQQIYDDKYFQSLLKLFFYVIYGIFKSKNITSSSRQESLVGLQFYFMMQYNNPVVY